ncbi:hypothetical protein M3Y99_00698600 [Aphelenchoides fujianensis]|nr:hypothetical protein M3Y99_00698600 [Aphelenchoides fujianensis]
MFSFFSLVVQLSLLVASIAAQPPQNFDAPLAKNCKEVLQRGGTRTGVYQIQTQSGVHSVLCDQDVNGGGWTVVQQRFDGQVRFWDRSWADYKAGFGQVDINLSFYAGNELIHELTNQFPSNASLRVEIYGDRNPGSPHAEDFYQTEYFFKLKNERSDYEASIFVDWGNGNASTGWYDITYSNGVKFSTIDHNNDPDPDCQQVYHLGGWWTHYCGLASLNGEYVPQRFGDGYGLFFTVEGQYIVNPRITRLLVRDREQ